MSKPISPSDVMNFLSADPIAPDAPQTPIDTEWQVKLAEHVDRFNKRFANVRYADKQMIMRFTQPAENADNVENIDFMQQHAFINLYQNTAIKIGEKVVKGETVSIYDNHANAWLKHFDCRVYREGVVFRPQPLGAKPLAEGYYNTWQGFSVDPKQGNCDRIYYHLREVVCDGQAVLYDYVLKWIAYKIQNPHKQAGSVLVLRGGKGSGKGTIGHFLKRLYGRNGQHISQTDHLTGKFNAHLADCCFLFADEAFFSGDKRGENTLKALITEPTLTIERKGFDPIEQENYLQILMATNEAWAVPASADERRYCVIDVSPKHTNDKAYFDAIHGDMERAGVQAAFLYDMLNLDLGNWRAGDIPDTSALKEQRLYSLDTVGQFLVDGFYDGGFSDNPLDGIQWRDYINATDLYNCYIYYCDRRKINQYGRESKCAFGRIASREAKLFKDDKGKGKTIRYCLHSIEDYQARLEESYRIKLDKQA